MFLRALFFALCLPFFLIGAVDQNLHHSRGEAPSWVKECDFPLEAAVKSSQVNLQYLLIDTQRNWEEKSFYYHCAVRTLTKSGIENISQLAIDFDPSYNQVVIHKIRVLRDGEWGDRLERARCQVIQRETDLERNLYNGDLTLIYFLDDIRVGDIVEYSYSLNGVHPLFSSHYTDRVYLQRDFAVEKIVHRLMGRSDFSFLIKPVSTDIEPKVCDLPSGLREWSWEAFETPPYLYEANQPVWHNPPIYIEMSQYQTWEEVAKKFSPLYVLPSDFAEKVPLEMQALVEKWKASAEETDKRALLALRFVQDQIRYLGIEEGMGAFQPSDPCLTFQRRFGDCKDKTFLLHALLDLMEIPSSPLLVHSSRGKRLPELLPTPCVFDHIVLQVKIDGAIYYVDPTCGLQGGSLQTNFFPDYDWGLILSEDSKELISLPKVVFERPTEIDTSCILESEDTARLKIKTVFYASRSDRWRRSLEWNGLKKIEEGSLATMQEVFGGASLDAPLEIVDDREKNVVVLTESYRLATEALSDKKLMKVFSYILRNYLDNQVNPDRTSPYQLYYPVWVKERIHIESPFSNWDPVKEDYQTDHESLLYTLSTRIEKNRATFDLELKHLQDHIPKHSLQSYWRAVSEIVRKSPGDLTIVSLASPKVGADLRLICVMAALGAVTMGGIIWLVIAIRKSIQLRRTDTEIARIRRNWLNSWGALIGYYGLSIILLVSLKFILGSESQEAVAMIQGIISFWWTIFCLFICFAFAYREPGTKFLTFFLVVSALKVLGNAFLFMHSENNLAELIEFLIFLPIFIWFQIASWDLRRLNKQTKSSVVMPSK